MDAGGALTLWIEHAVDVAALDFYRLILYQDGQALAGKTRLVARLHKVFRQSL